MCVRMMLDWVGFNSIEKGLKVHLPRRREILQGDTGGREKGFVYIQVRKSHLSTGLQGSYSNGPPSLRNTS